ncbi:MAG: rod shape determining protein RodA [Elusimicrobia bacterium]|nr:MAG: rod shape determining protein RodA [Elusimicrobiota bacterium]KAF0157524.1 MAG: rod shape determining protein RodA [Elusimicrobiota bacterium]
MLSRVGLKKGRMDWVILAAAAGLLFIGTLAVFSSVGVLASYERIVRTHLIAIPVALLFFSVAWSLNYQVYQDQWKFVYGLSLLFLAGVLFFGVMDKGSRSWYRLPFFSVQPSELARIGLIVALANYLDRRGGKMREFGSSLGALLLSIPFLLLLMKQPDFSAILTTFPVVLAMIFCAGGGVAHIAIIVGYAAVSALFPILWTLLAMSPELAQNPLLGFFAGLSSFGWDTLLFVAAVGALAWFGWFLSVKLYSNLSGVFFTGAALVVIFGFFSGMLVRNQMKEYQQKRLEVFLSPESDPRGAGYNLIQARIGMGSGGVFGKGVFSGTQSRLGFVPERHTDFILAVVGEEMGFMGTGLVMTLYLTLLYRLKGAAQLARDRFGYLLCCGIFSLYMVYFLINFGMLLGFAPVAGVPLPLVSYGGSNLVATFFALGLAESVYSRRYALV